MKVQLLTTLATLASVASGSALPHIRRQSNNTNGGIAPVPVQFVTTTVTAPNGAVQTVVVPININIAGTAGTAAVPASGAGAAPASGAGGVAPAANAGSGVSPVGSNTGLVTGSIQNGVCVCNGATVVAQGLYVGTVQTQIIVGTSTFVTARPVTTTGFVTVVGGQIIPATPVVTQTFFPVTNTNLPLPAGQQYQLFAIPGSITVTIIVTIGTGAAPGGNGGIAPAGIFPNGTAAATSAGSNGGIAGLPVAPTTSGVITVPAATSTGAVLGNPIFAASSTPAPVIQGTGAQTTPAAAGPTIGAFGQGPLVNQQSFIDAMLSQHNTYRARNQAPALVWDAALANIALANALQNARTGTLLHTPQQPAGSTPYAGTQPTGENIGFQQGRNNPAYIVYEFYQEESAYDPVAATFQSNAGHFTQLVWVSSQRLGCAYVSDNAANPTYYLACEYAPAGNVIGQFSTNVLSSNGAPFPAAPAQNV